MLGIFGKATRNAATDAGAPVQPVPVSAAARWRQARVVVQHEVLVSRWHKDVDRIHKRLWLSFKSSHTLMAGVVYKGYAGHTRAETIMILMNSLALEIVVLCMFYSLPSASPLTINPVMIIVNGSLCALICIPTMLIFAWLFQPQAFVIFIAWILRSLLCWPRHLHRCICRSRPRNDRITPAGASDQPEPPPSPPPLDPSLQLPRVACLAANAPLSDRCNCSTPLVTERLPSPPNSLVQQTTHGEMSKSQRAVNNSLLSPTPEHGKAVAGRSGSSGVRRLTRTMTNFVNDPPRRLYSYESLSDYFIRQSLTKSIKRRDWKAVVRLSVGWLLSYIIFWGLLLVFTLYGCEIYFFASENNATGTELLLSWAWSLFQRFIVNEPILILVGKLVPMLFSTALCANVCGETIANLAGYVVSGIMAFVKALRR